MGSLRGFAQLVHSSLPTGSSQVEPQGVNTPSFRLLAGASSICKQLRNAVGTVICIPLRGAPAEQGWGEPAPESPRGSHLPPLIFLSALPRCPVLCLAPNPWARSYWAGVRVQVLSSVPALAPASAGSVSGAHVHPTGRCASLSTPTDSVLSALPAPHCPCPPPRPVFPSPSGVACLAAAA